MNRAARSIHLIAVLAGSAAILILILMGAS